MKRIVLLTLTLGALAALPSTADAARSCGNVHSPDGYKWQIATAKAPCPVARDVGQKYINYQTNTEFHSRRIVINDKWGCFVGATIAGYCGRGNQGVWILSQVGEPVDHLHVTRPRLYAPESNFRRVLRDKYGTVFTGAYSRKVKCRKISRLRQRCFAAWGIGDSIYNAQGRVRLIPRDPFDVTRVTGRTKRLNDYCFSVQHRPIKKCLHSQRIGPVILH